MVDAYITGQGGFIGSHLWKKICTTSIPISHTRVRLTRFDDFRKFFFLSAYGNMAHHRDAGAMLEANVFDLLSVISKTTRTCESFIYVSTSSVNLPVQTSYSRTKRAAEEILLALPEIPACIVRPYSVTGAGEQKEHLIPTLIRSCMEGEEVQFAPAPVHDFVDVEDIVSGLILLADKKERGVFELGTGIPTSNAAVLQMVEEACGRKANVKPVQSVRPYDNTNWCCRDKRALKAGWKPTKTLAQSIREMVQDYERTRKAVH